MSQIIEIKVPDIGDYKDVPVIEVLVKAGDKIDKEQSIVVLESDKATMDVPSSHAGVVKEVKVKVGDTLSEGSVVITLEEGAPSSKVITTEPSDRVSPTLTLTSFTTPACEEGTSIVALSDSRTTIDCSLSILSPAFTRTSMTGTSL